MPACFSPDGQVVAYVSDESGRPEVYASSFPVPVTKVRVSSGGGGGSEPVWAPDGSAIYYRDGPRLMRAPILPGRTLSTDTPEELFLGAWTRVPASFPPPRTNWDITPMRGQQTVFFAVVVLLYPSTQDTVE